MTRVRIRDASPKQYEMTHRRVLAQLAELKARTAAEAERKRAALQARLDARKKAAFGAGAKEAEFAELEAEGAAELEALEGTLAASASAAVNAELVRQVCAVLSFLLSTFSCLANPAVVRHRVLAGRAA